MFNRKLALLITIAFAITAPCTIAASSIISASATDSDLIFSDGYTDAEVRVYSDCNAQSETLGIIPKDCYVQYNRVAGKWVWIEGDGVSGYTDAVDIKGYEDVTWDATPEADFVPYEYEGPQLSKGLGVNEGPSGKETYSSASLDVIKRMATFGYGDGRIHARDDGVILMDGFVVVAADLNTHNLGDLIPTSLGTGIVCDACDSGIVIATNW